jgi:hypothetical protein
MPVRAPGGWWQAGQTGSPSSPFLLLYAALERQFVEGLTAGAVKG